MRESKFQREVIWVLRKIGCVCLKQSERGYPDYLVVIPGGGSLFIEFKSETGKVSAVQVRRINALRRMSATVFVCSPSDPKSSILQILLICARYNRPHLVYILGDMIQSLPGPLDWAELGRSCYDYCDSVGAFLGNATPIGMGRMSSKGLMVLLWHSL